MLPAWVGDVSLVLVSLLVQGIPFLLFGAFLGAVVSSALPSAGWLRRWPRGVSLSALTGAVLALIVPACDCGMVPLVRRLVRKGAPLPAAIGYLFAAPSFNPICLLSTWLAFRLGAPWHMVALRAGGSLVLAVCVGSVAGRFAPASLLRPEVLFRAASGAEPMPWMTIHPAAGPVTRRAGTIVATGLTDFLNVSVLYVIGAVGSALLQTFLPLGRIFAPHTTLGIPAAMLLGFLFSLCSSADAFVVNAFGSLGLAGQLAFMWIGPVCSLRALILYRSIFLFRAIVGLAALTVLIVGAMAALVLRFGGA